MDELQIDPYELVEANAEDEEGNILRNHPTLPFELLHGTPRPLTTEHRDNSYENGNKNTGDYDREYGEDSHVDDFPANHKKFGDKEMTVPDYLRSLDKNVAATLDRISRMKDSNFNQEDGDQYTDEMFLDNLNNYNIAAQNILPETTREHSTEK